jgi:hypothetical protein
MSSNYPEGSMMGSGIYSDNWSGFMFCDDCEEDVAVEGQTNDWKTQAYADCPKCGADLEKEIDLNERDEDADYDAWRDSQLD